MRRQRSPVSSPSWTLVVAEPYSTPVNGRNPQFDQAEIVFDKEAIRRAKQLGAPCLAIYVTITERAQEVGHDRIYASNDQLADWSGLSVRTVQNHINELEEAGLIRIPSRGNGRGLKTVYQLVHVCTIKGVPPAPIMFGQVDAPRREKDDPLRLELIQELRDDVSVKKFAQQERLTPALLAYSLGQLVDKWLGTTAGPPPDKRTRSRRAVAWLEAGESTGRHGELRAEDPFRFAGVIPL